MAEDKDTGHPLDRQNAIERSIQIEGSKDPEHFKMPDGRTLAEVQRANRTSEDAEYQDEIQMLAQRTREQSMPEFQKGKKLVMTSVGNLVDVTEPVSSEKTITLAKSRTTAADIEEGAIQPLRERPGDSPSAPSGEIATPGGTPMGTTPATPNPSVGSTTPSGLTPSTPGK